MCGGGGSSEQGSPEALWGLDGARCCLSALEEGERQREGGRERQRETLRNGAIGRQRERQKETDRDRKAERGRKRQADRDRKAERGRESELEHMARQSRESLTLTKGGDLRAERLGPGTAASQTSALLGGAQDSCQALILV